MYNFFGPPCISIIVHYHTQHVLYKHNTTEIMLSYYSKVTKLFSEQYNSNNGNKNLRIPKDAELKCQKYYTPQ